MQLTVLRDTFTDLSTIGQLSMDDVFECYTMEPRKDQLKGKPYCIPAGTYDCDILWSHRFQMNTPHIMNVPGFENIEIHPGNYPTDTEGCLMVGSYRQSDFIGGSKAAFDTLMARLIRPLTITYL